MPVLHKNGQMTLVGIVITSVATIVASGLGGFFTAQSAAKDQVQEVSTKVQVVEEREFNHYSEIEKRLDSIDQKLEEIKSRQ